MMASDRKLSDFVQDLDLFCKVARELESGPASLRDIALRLDLSSVSLVSTSISRVEKEYGNVTLISRSKGSGQNSLTDEGRRVFERGERVLEAVRDARSSRATTLRVAASHLLLVYVLPDFIRRYLALHAGSSGNIEFNDACQYEETIRLLTRGSLDFALVWDLPGRKRYAELQPFLGYEQFKSKLDVVAICRPNHEFAKKAEVRIEDFGEQKVFVLHDQHQPFLEYLPQPYGPSGSRVELKDYTTIISHIQMGFDGIALVPGVYGQLDYWQKLGTLVHIPVTHKGDRLSMRIAGVFRVKDRQNRQPTMSADAFDLYKMIKKYFDNGDNLPRSGWRSEDAVPTLLPKSFDFRPYGQAHFMVLTSEGSVKVPEWRQAKIEWGSANDAGKFSGLLSIVGPVDGTALCDSYDVTAGPLSDHVYYLEAKPRSGATYKPEIVATFHMAFKLATGIDGKEADPKNKGKKAAPKDVLFGFGYGVDKDNKPTIGTFLLTMDKPDDKPIPHHMIASGSRLGMLRVSTNHVDRPPKGDDAWS